MPPDADPLGVLLLGTLLLLIFLGVLLAWSVVLARLAMGEPVLPRRRPLGVSWGGQAVVGTFMLWVGLNVVMGVVLKAFRPGEAGELTALEKMAAVSVLNVVLIGVLPRSLARWSRDVPGELGLRGRVGDHLRDAATGVLAALFLAPPVYAIQLLAVQVWNYNRHPLQDMVMAARDGRVALLAVVAAVVLAPIVEELMFRGIFQGWLDRLARRDPPPTRPTGPPEPLDQVGAWTTAGIGPPPEAPHSPEPWEGEAQAPPSGDPPTDRVSWRSVVALVVPAGVFAGVHAAQWPAPIPLFLLALGLGLVYRRTAGLVAPIAMHATFNALSTLVLIVAVQFNLIPRELTVPPADRVPEAAAVEPIPQPAPAFAVGNPSSVESSVSRGIFPCGAPDGRLDSR